MSILQSESDSSLHKQISRRFSKWGSNALVYIALSTLSIPVVFPFLWMLSSSFKTANQIFAFPPTLLPKEWHWRNFIEIFTYQPFARHYLNSLYIAVLVTVGTLIISSLAGYAFARIQFPGNSFLFLLLLSALMMPSQVTIIPNFLFMKTLGLIDTHIPLIILPMMGLNGVIATFIMRQFFLSLPREIEESAMIDGLDRLGILYRIALPLARPALGSVAILTFLYSWNLFLEPLIFIESLEKFTLPLSLRNFADIYGMPIWNLQLAATTLATIPVLIVYFFAQQQVLETFALSGVKG